MPKVHFTREKKVVECEAGANLRQLALKNGVELYPGLKRHLNCGGKSLCGDCRVHVLAGMENLSPKRLLERFRIGVSWFKLGHEHEVRLACQTHVLGDVEVLTQPEFNWFGEKAR
jgi:ferredoxin